MTPEPGGAVLSVSREQVLAFRLQRHHLAERLPHSRWREAVQPVGLRNAVPGSLEAQLHARVRDVSGHEAEEALRDRSLVEVMSTHGLHVVPPSDVPTLTLGAVPASAGGDDLDAAYAAALEVTADGPVQHGDLSHGITERIDPALSPYCKVCGCSHVSPTLFRYASQRAQLCRVPDGDGLVDRASRVVDGLDIDVDASVARRDLVRRFLQAHGPASVADVAWWFNLPAREAEQELRQQVPELIQVSYGGRQGWMQPEDVDALNEALPPQGVRIVPPYDPLLTTGDRQTLAPEPAEQRALWRVVANAGAVLVNGEVVAAWRSTKRGRRLGCTLRPFHSWRRRYLDAVKAELDAVGALRGCDRVTVAVNE